MQVKKQFIKDQSKKIQLQCVETVKPLIQGSKYDGLVFLGAGGDFEEWYTGIVNILEDEKCISSVLDFDQLYYFKNLNGRIDLVFPFARNNSIDIPRLAMWRLKAYSSLCPKWLSDYVDQV
jgi:hypothetical protein